MRVLQVSNDLGKSSGVGYFVRRIADELTKLGVKSPVVSSVAELESVTERPDVVHIHGLWLGIHRAAARWARSRGVPLVWSTHGMTAPWAMRHKWWKKWPAWWLYQKRDLHRATAIHCTTDLEVEWNRRLGLTRTVIVPLGADIPQSPNQTPPTPQTPPTQTTQTIFHILFVGRIYPVKGLVNLVRAAAVANEKLKMENGKLSGGMSGGKPNRLMEFRLVGPDQGGHLAELQVLARELGVENVEFPGAKHGEDLAKEYAWCDVLVLPSFTENFGGVVVDALAQGKPVIASRFTPWEVLEKRRCGWWVSNAPESLAKTLVEVSSLSRETLVEMGRSGRRLVEEEYAWPMVAERMRAEYVRNMR